MHPAIYPGPADGVGEAAEMTIGLLSQIGRGVVLDTEETADEGIANAECLVLNNAPRGYLRVYVREERRAGRKAFSIWVGPHFVFVEQVQMH